VILGVFHNVFDWTAVGTLAVAAVTLALAAATFWMVHPPIWHHLATGTHSTSGTAKTMRRMWHG